MILELIQLKQNTVTASESNLNLIAIYTLTNTVHVQKSQSVSSYAFLYKTIQTVKKDKPEIVNITKYEPLQ